MFTVLQKPGICIAFALTTFLLGLVGHTVYAQCKTGCTQTYSLTGTVSTGYTVNANNTLLCIRAATGSVYYNGVINVNNRTNVTLCIGPNVRFANNNPFSNVGAGFKVINYGSIDPALTLNSTFIGLDNYGTVSGNITANTGGTFTNRASGVAGHITLTVAGGTFVNDGSLSTTSNPIQKLTVSSGTFTNNGALYTNNLTQSGGTITGAGSYNLNGFTKTGGSFTSSGSFYTTGNFEPDGGSLAFNGPTTFTNMVKLDEVDVTVTFGGPTIFNMLEVSDATTVTFNAPLTVKGGITIKDHATVNSNVSLTLLSGQLQIKDASFLNIVGTVDVRGQIVNSATLRVPASASSGCNTIVASGGVQNTGSITAPPSSPLYIGNTVSGSVGTNVTVTNAPPNQPGSLSLSVGTNKQQITCSFTAATGTPAPSGYVVLRRLGNTITSSNYPRSGQTVIAGAYLNSAKIVAVLPSSILRYTDAVDSCGTYYYAVVSSTISTPGPCGFYSTATASSQNTELSQASYSTIAYPQTLYCASAATSAVTVTGAAGGTFTTNKVGLNINSSGVISAPSMADTGSATITYTIPARNGCAAATSTTAVRLAGKALVYTWAGSSSGSLASAGSWSPSRGVLNSCDVLNIKSGGNITLTSATTQTLRQLRITNNTTLTLTSAAAANLTLTGEGGVGLFVEAGSSLRINAATLTLTVGSGAVALVNGRVDLVAGVLDVSGSRVYVGSTSGSFTPFTRTAGTMTTSPSTHLQFGYSGNTAMANFTFPNGFFTNNPAVVRSLTLQTATASLSLGNQGLRIVDTLQQPSGKGELILNGNELRLQGLVVGNPQLDGSAAASKLSLEGDRSVSGIRFAAPTLSRLRLSRAYARAITLPIGADLTISDSIIFNTGIVNTGSQKIIVATTASLGAESDSSFILGIVEQQRTLAQGVANTFSNMRISIQAMGAAPGLTSVTRYNAVQPDLGGGTLGTRLRFDIHTANPANLNATLSVRLLNTEMAGLPAEKLIFARSTTGTYPWQAFGGTDKNAMNRTYTLTGIAGFSSWTLGNEDAGVLPVSLASFTGKQVVKGRNQLNWQTASEKDNKGFTVLRSQTGERYDSLGFVPSKAPGGTSSTSYHYAYTDYAAPAAAYYRLKQTDFKGRTEIFHPIHLGDALEIKTDLLSLYPNPISDDQFTLLYKGKEKTPCTIRLTNQKGAVLYYREITLTPGWEKMIGLPPLTIGIYLLELKLGNGKVMPVRVVRS